MAHIANFLVDVDTSYISKQASHHPSDSTLAPPPPEKPFTWRMQPEPQRKYQLFPRERKLPVLNNNTNKAVDVEKPLPAIMPEQQQTGNSSSKRLNQHGSVRRRKASVTDLGPMTTVHEVAMDSPTIPGRLPFHERSNSAPGHSTRKHTLTDTFFYDSDDDASEILSPVAESLYSRASMGPLSPKQLAPLMIPKSEFAVPHLRRQQSLGSFPTRNESLRNDRVDYSPRSRASLTTPSSSLPDLGSPNSASTTATLPTPVSAPFLDSRTTSPNPWDGRCTTPITYERSASAQGHIRGGSEPTIPEEGRIIDRGRPKKRSNSRNNNAGPIIQRSESRRRSSLDQSASQPQQAHERLPEGIKLSEATEKLDASELMFLQKQAMAQAERFEILRPADVEMLSRELRHLDERTEYLRRTYHSLRVGRRNLHSRICQYLRSPRTVKFSHESMLRQEEALAELDASIDDWVNKLEQSENRRMRVRQKLLEHVAAAATLSVGGVVASSPVVEVVQQMVGPAPSSGIGNITTPPRSPSKQSFTPAATEDQVSSPHRSFASVPSTIMEQPLVEGVAASKFEDRITSQGVCKRVDVESIRVYAGDDVYALLADVENEITRMSKTANLPVFGLSPNSTLPEGTQIALHRQRSHEMLNGGSETSGETSKTDTTRATPTSPRGKSTARKDAPSMFILANTVYKP